MFTATGFIVMCVAASSTCTANAVESPPRPCGPTPNIFTALDNCASNAAPPGSAHDVPSRPTAVLVPAIGHGVNRNTSDLDQHSFGALGDGKILHHGTDHRLSRGARIVRSQRSEAALDVGRQFLHRADVERLSGTIDS